MRRLLIFLPLAFLAPTLSHTTPIARSSDRPVPEASADKGDLPGTGEMERLAQKDPVAFLEGCLRSYDAHVKGYHTVLRKQERLGGELQPSEEIDVTFRDNPYSVVLRWLKGARLARQVLYVAGANDDKMLVRPALALFSGMLVERDPDSDEARQSGRYSIKEFGLKKGMERTLGSWKAAQAKKDLHVEYLGEVKVKEAGDRLCLGLRRTRYARPEADGVRELTIYVDKETWLQVGSVLKDEDGKVIGAYYFRDVQLNPDFKSDPFKRSALNP